MTAQGSDDLDTAIAGWRALLEQPSFASMPSSFRLQAVTQAGQLYATRYGSKRVAEDLDRAIALVEDALGMLPADSVDRSSYLNNLGAALEGRFGDRGEPADLDRAIEAFEQAASCQPDAPHAPKLLDHLGTALERRYEISGDTGDLDHAIEVIQRAAEAAEGTADRPGFLDHLASTLRLRYNRVGSLVDMEEAIARSEAAVREPGPDGSLPMLLSNLAGHLHDRFRHSGDRGDLERAVALRRDALERTPPGSGDYAWRLYHLAASLALRYDETGDAADLDQSIAYGREALSMTRPTDEEFATRANDLGIGLARRYQRTGQLQDLEEGIDALRSGVAATPAAAPGRARRLLNLAYASKLRLGGTGDAEAIDQLVGLYRSACEHGLGSEPHTALRAADGWLAWATERASWSEAVEAARSGIEATDRLLRTQLRRAHKETWLREVYGFAPNAALAMVRAGDTDAATVALERSRALLLSTSLERSTFDLSALVARGRADLADRYAQAAARLDALERDQLAATPTASTATLQAAQTELTATVAEVRKLPGYENFQNPPDFADVAAAAAAGPLVYLAAARAGGLALVVSGNSTPLPVWLPELTEGALRRRLEAYRSAYADQHLSSLSGRPGDKDRWAAALDKTTRWLWDVVMGPVLDALPVPRAVLVPAGLLGYLPLHAAWTEDEGSPVGRRYALDAALLTYAPNARARAAAVQAVARSARVASALVVEDPQPVAALPLPFTALEARAVLKAAPAALHLRGRQATRSAVLAALADRSLLHFACHGRADPAEPLASGLLLAGDESLSLRDLLAMRLAGTRLAVLSACETAFPGMHLPDEVVSLPTGLLQAGAGGVMGSLWAVSDASTTLLMAWFYRTWKDGVDPAEALRNAQQWLRDTTNGEKKEAFPEAFADLRSDSARTFWASARGHSHPQHWAAFTFVGA